MTFPAWLEFCKDKDMRRQMHAHVIYAELLTRPKSFSEPVTVKAWAFAQLLSMRREDVSRALDLLIRAGYLDEHPREHNKAPRRVTVAFARRACPQTSEYSAA